MSASCSDRPARQPKRHRLSVSSATRRAPSTKVTTFSNVPTLCASCALPVVSAGTFLPAGDLRRGDVQASASMEVGRVLAGPGDLGERAAVPPETARWEVLTWIASDVSVRWQAFERMSFEAQLKLAQKTAGGEKR